jgi:uncharacterized protein (DUF1684 family)
MTTLPPKHANELDEQRKFKDDFFRQDKHSPLTQEQRSRFTGLTYYPDNPALRLELPLEKLVKHEKVKMQTSTGDVQTYTRLGKVNFRVGGEIVYLTVFGDSNGYFIPFADSMAGKETYGAGRYLEPELMANGNLLVDFNQAYNPYCAYNEYYSCPLTPSENRLKVPIRAGEKLPQGDWASHAGSQET